MKATDVRVESVQLYLLPIDTRTPLKFGNETLTSITCARVRVVVTDRRGRSAEGWGETPLSVQWAWPGRLAYSTRYQAMRDFCAKLVNVWATSGLIGHPLEIGAHFQSFQLPKAIDQFNVGRPEGEGLPYLASLICYSAFDIAAHDAYGNLHATPVYATYNPDYMSLDLDELMSSHGTFEGQFRRKFPASYLNASPPKSLPVWHLVGAADVLDITADDYTQIDDGYPNSLTEWIDRDGIRNLKIKLTGTSGAWDLNRIVEVGNIGETHGVQHLSVDFNCTVTDPAYVVEILDRLAANHPAIYESILYVEQPFPYELAESAINVREVTRRKPIFLDESAHDWTQVKLGHSLGWNGVALKTCKSQTGAILSLCWARQHGMAIMVQDLTNPMLAQVAHLSLAAHADTIMGVEANAMQFYPDASDLEARVHPGIFMRRSGSLDLSTIGGPGIGYASAQHCRTLPPPFAAFDRN